MSSTLVKLAFRNLRRNGKRSISTGMAIAAGFAAFMIAAGYAYRVKNVLSYYTIYGLRVGHIGIYHQDALEMYSIKPKEYSITEAEQQAVEASLSAINNVEMFGRYLTGQGLVGNGCKTFPFMAVGVDMKVEERVMNHPLLISWNKHILKSRIGDSIWTFPEETGAVALSEGLASLLGKEKLHRDFQDSKPVLIADCAAPDVRAMFAGDANVQLAAGTWDGTLGAVDGEYVQKFSTGLIETNNASITTGLTHLQKLYNTSNVTNFSVWLKDPRSLHATVAEINKNLQVSAPRLRAMPWIDDRLSPYYTGTMQFIYVMVGFIGCVLAIVVILSIFNSATMTIIERSQEVGMFRSVGYNRGSIRRLFLMEGLFLTVIAVFIGAIIGFLAMWIVNELNIVIHPPGVANGIQLMLVPNIWIVLAGALGVSMLGIGSTLIAVSGVVKQNIANLVSGPSR
jgi:putative ABC transport system permease protein